MKTISEKPTTEKRGNTIIYSVEAALPASPEVVWQKLINIEELLRWDSMLIELDGTIGPGGKIKLRSAISPKQTFSLKVSKFVPNKKMVWSSGMGPLFKGIRTYDLKPHPDGTHFHMHETFSGFMLPLIQNKLPDCDTLFGTYIKDLKKELTQPAANENFNKIKGH